MSKLDKDAVIAKFEDAYKKANGKVPDLVAKGGWYSVDGGKNMRLAQLDELADSLASNDTASEEKSVVSSKNEEKPKAADSKKAAKPAKKKASKSKTKKFSVKDFYTQQIQEANPGAKAPR